MNRVHPSQEIVERIEKFQRLLDKHRVDGALISHPIDLYYFTGIWHPAMFWIPTDNKPLLLGKATVLKEYEDLGLELIDCPIDNDEKIGEHIKDYHIRRLHAIGLEWDVLPANRYLQFKRCFHSSNIEDVSALVRRIRMIKSSNEISIIRKAAELGDRLFQRIPEFIKSSETEIDLAIKAEEFYRSHGHSGTIHFRAFNREVFYGHIMAGGNAAVPGTSPGPTAGQGLGPFYPQGPGKGRLQANAPILIDYPSIVDGYIADQTRIFSIGKISQKFQEPHLIMLEVQQEIAKKGKPGTNAKDLYAFAFAMIKKAGLETGFMGYPQSVPFVGHGIGLELDEWPIISKHSDHVLQKGMVIAIEPKYFLPGKGVVGIENTFVVTDNGMERLNQFPDQIAIVD